MKLADKTRDLTIFSREQLFETTKKAAIDAIEFSSKEGNFSCELAIKEFLVDNIKEFLEKEGFKVDIGGWSSGYNKKFMNINWRM